jgi:hypothetical protein
MSKPKAFFRVFTESGPLIALAVATALLLGIAGPASAQFFNFGNFGGPPRSQPRSNGFGGGSEFDGEYGRYMRNSAILFQPSTLNTLRA